MSEITIEQALRLNAEASIKLADAMTKYASVIEKYGVAVESKAKSETAGGGSAKSGDSEKPETPAQKKKREAAEAEAAAAKEKEDDGFGDDDGGEATRDALTADDVKKQLLKVRDANGGDKAPAIDIIKKYGYNAIPEVQEKDFFAVYDDCQKWLDKNA